MREEQERTALLLGEQAVSRLEACRVAVFGIGGVGGFATEALARAGIGRFLLVDSDVVSRSNINRQIIALQSTVGQPKVAVMAARIHDIAPQTQVQTLQTLYLPESSEQIPLAGYDYIVDAIDNVSGKIELAVRAKEAGVPIISCMGAGNKLDATRFEVEDLAKTSVCPLARVMRYELKKRGITHMKVVYSREQAIKTEPVEGKRVPGSVSFVPSVAGLILAGEVIKDLAKGARE